MESTVNKEYKEVVGKGYDAWAAQKSMGYWMYRAVWQEYPYQHILTDFPIHLDIDITSACNLRCTMCPRTDFVNAGTFWKVEMFDFEHYKRIIDEGAKTTLCAVKFNILGEPTLNPQLIDYIKYAKQAGIIDVMLNTNATKLTDKMSRQLIESGLDQIFFSFDSANADTYNAIRIGAKYEKVLDNIIRFCDLRDEMGSVNPLTRASMVLMPGQEQEWQDFQDLFAPIVDVVGYGDYLDHTGQGQEAIEGKDDFCCPSLWQRMMVHPDGVVQVCCVDSARTIEVGNVNEQSLSEIWQGEAYTRLRELHASGRYDEIPQCAKCPLARL